MADASLTRGYSQMDDVKPARSFKDVEWAVVFLAHIVGVVVIGGVYMPELVADVRAGAVGNGSDDMKVDPDVMRAVQHAAGLSLPFVGLGLGVSLGWALLWITIVQAYARQLIYIALFAAPVLFGALTVVMIGSGSAGAAIWPAILCAFCAYYAYWIINQPGRVQFAQLCLTSIATVIRKYPGTYLTAFLSIVPATAYQLGWLAATSAAGWHFYKLGEPYTAIDQNGVEHEARSFPAAGKALLLFLALSNYWTSQVVTNVVHVTNAGVVATWYFMAHQMPSSPSLGSLRRACTTSFGSICLGSLLVAIVQLLRDMAESARRESDGAFGMVLMCCVSCFLGYIEALLELFNHWAFVQVGIYGKDFKTAAKDTLQLVKSKGLSGLVNMNLTGSAVALGVMIGMVLSGALVGLSGYSAIVSPSNAAGVSAAAKPVYMGAYVSTIVISVILASVFAGMVSSTVTSGTTTLFVCFAEDPAALQASNPELHARFEQITADYLLANPYDGPEPPTSGGAAPVAQHMYGGQPPQAYAVPARGSANA